MSSTYARDDYARDDYQAIKRNEQKDAFLFHRSSPNGSLNIVSCPKPHKARQLCVDILGGHLKFFETERSHNFLEALRIAKVRNSEDKELLQLL